MLNYIMNKTVMHESKPMVEGVISKKSYNEQIIIMPLNHSSVSMDQGFYILNFAN